MTERAAFEIAIGAILTQSTSWKNVELAIGNLKRARVLRPTGIARLPLATLTRLIRPSGYYQQKAKKLKAFAAWLNDHGGRLLVWSSKRTLREARTELLTVHGIGPETADSILLYACSKPTFVVDAYTKRFLTAHGRHATSYDAVKRYFTERLPRSAHIYQEYHALIVRWGKEKSE